MFELKAQLYFSAAHHLLNYDGECENQHGHNWLVEAYVKGEALDKSNILVDYKVLKKELKAAQDELQTLKDSAPNIDELRENIRNEIKAEYDLKFYREKKIQEANGKIIPELVSGNTEEEINASVEKSMARYNEIVGAVTPPPVVNPKLNPANPSSTPLKTSSDAMKALLELDPLSKEYAEARKALGFK